MTKTITSQCKVRVDRTKTEKFLLACIAPAVQQCGEAVMISGVISSEGHRDCKVVTRMISSEEYTEKQAGSDAVVSELAAWPQLHLSAGQCLGSQILSHVISE